MADSKRYFTVEELVTLCEKLNLETSGSKAELISRFQTYEPVSRVSIRRTRIIPSISVSAPENNSLPPLQSEGRPQGMGSFLFRMKSISIPIVYKIPMIVNFVGCMFGLYELYKNFFGVETIVVIQRSLFDW